MTLRDVVVVGFDSAWTDKVKGAICAVTFQEGAPHAFYPPQLVSFDEAHEFIEQKSCGASLCLVAIDQPTIVNNIAGCRPVDRIAASVISYVGGGVQPANRSRSTMFGAEAPIWKFKKSLNASDHPETAQAAKEGRYLIEVFPALSLTAWNPAFRSRLGAPKYNPANRARFKKADWLSVHETLEKTASDLHLSEVADWLRRSSAIHAPRKHNQDEVDSIVCLLSGVVWRFSHKSKSMVLGDTETGFIVAPIADETRIRLTKAAQKVAS
jgi:predicted RNase H-like nuclease